MGKRPGLRGRVRFLEWFVGRIFEEWRSGVSIENRRWCAPACKWS